MKLPIFDNRNIVGFAANEKQAHKIIKKSLQSVPAGWVITVKRRNTEIINLPDGFVYSVHPIYK